MFKIRSNMLSWWVFLFAISHLHTTLSKPSIITIGAGPAGIAAATKLLENSITNITILEAENRTGGRINSFKFVNGIVDLGAQYCHGVKGNVAYDLAKNYNILEPGLRGLQTNIYYSNGTKLEFTFVKELQDFYFNYNKIESSEFINVRGKSLGDFIIYKYNNTFFKKYNSDEDKIKLLQEGLHFLEGYILIHEGVFSWLHPSAECDYIKCAGPQNLVWQRVGYKTVLELMTKEYPDPSKKLPIDDKIHLSTSVEKIISNNSHTVEVLTNDQKFSADYVIFTPSVGVLKRLKDSMFEPQLPSFKKEAIEATGFEGVIKVFLYFSIQWWNDTDDAFGFYWAKQDVDHLFGCNPEMFWTTQFRYILKVPENSNVWVGWISGDLVPEIEALPLDVFKTGCEYVLQTFLGNTYNLTKITKIIRSNWVTNKNFGGTYSYTKTGFYSKNHSYQADLAKPLIDSRGKPVVLFAGEATNPIHYSTVHGAIESGYREAERILNLHKPQR